MSSNFAGGHLNFSYQFGKLPSKVLLLVDYKLAALHAQIFRHREGRHFELRGSARESKKVGKVPCWMATSRGKKFCRIALTRPTWDTLKKDGRLNHRCGDSKRKMSCGLKSNYKFVEELDARWNYQKQIEVIVGAVMKIKLRPCLYLAVIVVLLGANASLAEEAQRHWLIGQWQGSIQDYPRPSGAARTLDVKAVSPDGTTVGSWGVTGQELFPCDIRVNGLQVTVTVTVSGSVVQLLKEGNDGLVGIFTPGNGKEYPIRLNRADRPSGSPRQEKSQAN